ncbi:MAG: winged helix-turn-helix transcriptional regulator [Gammaproteobacteria bacterium]
MSKSRFLGHECPLARALDQIGDWWTLLVVRECMYGTRRFEGFRRQLGISRAVLVKRLHSLTEAGILEKITSDKDKRAVEYCLTAKGLDLWPLMVTLLIWSNRHVVKGDVVSVHHQDSACGIEQICAVNESRQPIPFKELSLVCGKDASPAFSQRIKSINSAWRKP